jgi:hypothetical protein
MVPGAYKPVRVVRIKQKENTMATAKKEQKIDVLEQLKLNATRKGGTRLKDRTYAVKREWTPEELANVSLSPQGIACVGVILGMEKDEVSEKELFNAFNDAEDQFTGSKQSPWQIFTYYRKKIEYAGFLTEVHS